MPMNRSPPKTLTLSVPPNEIVITQDSDTASDKVLSDIEQRLPGTSRRPKRKHDDVANAEIKELLCDMQKKQNTEFRNIKQDMEAIKKQNSESQKSLEFLSNMYDSLLQKFEKIEKENLSHKSYIKSLETKVEQLERSMKSSSIEVRNIPLVKPETKTTLKTHVLRLSEAVNQPLQDTEIRDIYRIRTKYEPGPIIVEFTTTISKENLVRSVIGFNKGKGKGDKINTSHLKIPGNSVPIYVTDNLTTKSRRLFYLAREYTKTHQQASCWTAFGKVFIRLKDGQPTIRLDTEDDIINLGAQQ